MVSMRYALPTQLFEWGSSQHLEEDRWQDALHFHQVIENKTPFRSICRRQGASFRHLLTDGEELLGGHVVGLQDRDDQIRRCVSPFLQHDVLLVIRFPQAMRQRAIAWHAPVRLRAISYAHPLRPFKVEGGVGRAHLVVLRRLRRRAVGGTGEVRDLRSGLDVLMDE